LYVLDASTSSDASIVVRGAAVVALEDSSGVSDA
jgi:hypothetical protein